MLGLSRIPIERQRNVGAALADIFKSKTPYKADVVSRAKEVIAATSALAETGGPSMFAVDRATDSVVTAIYRMLDAWEKGLTDAVLPLTAEQQAALAAVDVLQTAWFSNGIDFIHEVVGLQHDALAAIRKTFAEQPIKQAVQTLGLGPMVERLSSHTALYSKTLGLSADSEAEASGSSAGQAWHDAYVLFTATVMTAYADDAEARKVLLGSYEKQLQEHRAAMQKERRRRRADKEPK